MSFKIRKFNKSSDRVKKHRFLRKLEACSDNINFIDEDNEKAIDFGNSESVEAESEWIERNLENIQSDDDKLIEGTSLHDVSEENLSRVPNSDNDDDDSSDTSRRSDSDEIECPIDERQSLKVNLPLQVPIAERIQQWAISNLGDIKLKSVTEILEILNDYGHSMPSTAHKLLGFQHRIKSRKLITSKNKIGTYVYLGISNALKHRISPDIYDEDVIRVLIFIDGMKVYQNSKGQLWPIALKIFHPKYVAAPSVIALYYGDSKPKNVNDFLEDFVEEATQLITHGITILGRFYKFKIIALIGDSLARAYLKCSKSPTGFFSCERCTVAGVTINKKRVFPDSNCALRTAETFKNLVQIQHHLLDKKTKEPLISPLLRITSFDPIKHVPLEVMHLLFLNVMKNLGEKWTKREKNKYKLSVKQVKIFEELMESIDSKSVPSEFQRDTFDVTNFSHWKATQYSFLLLYVGPIVLQSVLDETRYKHYLLLCVACRLLCNNEWVLKYHQVARVLLREFVTLMPTYYGRDCQTMVFHNLIHLSDDAEYFGTSLSDYSAFWGENYIGKLKNLVSSKAKPIPQIVNRLQGRELSPHMKIKKRLMIENVIQGKVTEISVRNGKEFLSLDSITYCDMILTPKTGNNVVQLQDDYLFTIQKIWLNVKYVEKVDTPDEIFIEGFRAEKQRDIFKNPCPSREVEISQIKKWSNSLEFLPLRIAKHKYMLLEINRKEYAMSLLHT